MLKPAIVTSEAELRQVLELQRLNLRQNVSPEEKASQGFVTVQHDLETLQAMHRLAPSVIVKDGPDVVAYALSMLPECRQLIPVLGPMFDLFDRLTWNDKSLDQYRYYVMGQVCVAKDYRGRGLTDLMYLYHREIYRERFDLFLTEISTRNPRSIRAHERVGFRTIHTYRDEVDEWIVVGWDWS